MTFLKMRLVTKWPGVKWIQVPSGGLQAAQLVEEEANSQPDEDATPSPLPNLLNAIVSNTNLWHFHVHYRVTIKLIHIFAALNTCC